jgi:ADP-heptose:LPS heptosyltransferase
MLVAAPQRWDEACFAVPAVRALVASGLGVGVLCPEIQAEFWHTVAGVTVLTFPSSAKVKAIAGTLATRPWQASLAWELGPAAEAFKAAKIPRRLGPAGLKKYLTHPLTSAAGPLDHRVRHYLSLVEELGVPTARAEYFAPAALGIEAVPAAVLLCPGSDFGENHEWPVEQWVSIANGVLDYGRRITVASVDSGRGLAKSLAEALGPEVEFFDATPLAGVLPLLAVHSLVVAADGSLPHLAAYAGTTCVTLFGPNDPLWKRPLGKRHAVVRRHVECAPCLAPKCVMDLRCQHELTTERVWAAVKSKL